MRYPEAKPNDGGDPKVTIMQRECCKEARPNPLQGLVIKRKGPVTGNIQRQLVRGAN